MKIIFNTEEIQSEYYLVRKEDLAF